MAMGQYDPFQVEGNMQFKENEERSFSTILEGNLSIPPLGLKLTITPAFIDLIESTLAQDRKRKRTDDFNAESKVEKMKASNFPASSLKIGSWERIPKNEGDLIAKLYYSKRKFVVEMLEVSLKNKIEIQWSDISAIRAQFPHKDFAFAKLEIELNQPPTFFRETNPQPRKHTIWESSSDFTGGQAQTYRRLTVLFPPGTLETHYINLLQCDPRLFDLSRKPYPSDENPYFHQPNHPIQNLTILPSHLTDFQQNTNPISPMIDGGGSSYFANQNQLYNPVVYNQNQVLDEGGNISYYANTNQLYNQNQVLDEGRISSYSANTSQLCNPAGVNNQIQCTDYYANHNQLCNPEIHHQIQDLDGGGSSFYTNQNQLCNNQIQASHEGGSSYYANRNQLYNPDQNQVFDEGGNSSYYANQNQLCNPAGVNNQIQEIQFCNTQVNSQNQVRDSIAVATIPGNANQNYYLNHGEDLSATMNNPSNMFEIQQPENFPPTLYSNEMEYLTAFDFQQEVANTIPDPPQQLNFLFQHQQVSNTIPYHPPQLQQPNWLFPHQHQQVSDNNIFLNSSVTSSMYPYVRPT